MQLALQASWRFAVNYTVAFILSHYILNERIITKISYHFFSSRYRGSLFKII